MSQEIAFNSKIDLWLLIVLLAVVAACLWGITDFWNAILAQGWVFTLAIALPLGAGVLMPLWILLSLRYYLSDRTLRIRCGPFRWIIPIDRITAVTPAQDPLSSPALSLDRLRVDYGKGSAVVISPEPRAEFLRQLEHRRKQA
jgi:membrane protein YdbS with pleckstrin-like domain